MVQNKCNKCNKDARMFFSKRKFRATYSAFQVTGLKILGDITLISDDITLGEITFGQLDHKPNEILCHWVFLCFFLQVVGLGNYTLPNTRHSVGMLVVDCLSQQLGASWQFNRRSLGHVAVTKVNNHQLIMLKPTLAMNVNGKSISRTGVYLPIIMIL